MVNLTLDWLHVVALLGAMQGLFLAGALAAKRSNRTANRLLAVAMVTFSVSLATSVYHAAGLERRFPHFFGAGYPLPLLFGPLVYLYALAAADRSRRLTRRDALHLLPFVMLVVAALPIYLMSGAEKVAFYQRLQAGERPPLLAIADPLKLLSGIAYTAATIRFLHRHREQVKESYSSIERVNLRWLLWLAGSAATIWFLAVVLEVVQSAGIALGTRSDDIITLAVAALVYLIGYMGLRQPEIFRYETAEYAVPVRELAALRAGAGITSDAPAEDAGPQPPAPADDAAMGAVAAGGAGESRGGVQVTQAPPRYERSGLTERQAERLRVALMEVMDRERPWQDSELTLADLAARLKTTPHKLSEVLNSQLGITFYDFVNGYRVREVQRRIAAGEAQRVKMLTLALDAGFASKSTFNMVFKKHTSQTPSDYRQAAGA